VLQALVVLTAVGERGGGGGGKGQVGPAEEMHSGHSAEVQRQPSVRRRQAASLFLLGAMQLELLLGLRNQQQLH
jgi:hypothetical protein